MHYYQHHLGDYAKDTGHLSVTEHGAYRLLLDHYYSTEASLPLEIEKLCRIARAFSRAERDAVARVAREFFVEKNSTLTQKRVELELAEYRRLKARNTLNGQLGGRPKKNRDGTQPKPSGLCLGNPDGNPNESNASASHDPVTNIHKPVLLEKEPKGRGAPSKRQRLFDEACRTSEETPIPKPLQTDAFTSVWSDFCRLRERMTKEKGIEWAASTAAATLKECAELGVEWAAIEVRTAVSKSWRGLYPDQRRNPADVRSQPMLECFNGKKAPDHRMDDRVTITSLER